MCAPFGPAPQGLLNCPAGETDQPGPGVPALKLDPKTGTVLVPTAERFTFPPPQGNVKIFEAAVTEALLVTEPGQGGQPEHPPQSTPCSFPFMIPSVHDGGVKHEIVTEKPAATTLPSEVN